MSAITEGLRSILTADASVAALVGTRVWFASVPEGAPTLPAITVEQVSGYPIGGIREDTVWEFARVQVDVFAATAASLSACVVAVRAALCRYHGAASIGGGGTITIDDCQLDNIIETEDASLDTHRSVLDFVIHFANG